MACLEHACSDCGHEWFDNNPSRCCPACGSTNTARYFDEVDGPEDDDTEDSECE